MEITRTVRLNNGIEMERMGVGCWESLGQEAADAVRTALELGYRRIDTAMYYQNEREVGQGFLKSGVPREKVFIASKIWYTDMCGGRQEETFYKSLEDLGLEYLDLYYLHWPLGEVLPSWRVLERLYEAGKIRAIGVCNFQRHHLEELLAKANVCPAVDQFESNPRFSQQELADFCLSQGIVPEAWGPLGKGRDLGLPLLEELGRKYGKSTAQIILRWHLQRGFTAIPKSVHENRLRQNLEVFDFSLGEQDMQAISGLDTGVSRRKPPEGYAW